MFDRQYIVIDDFYPNPDEVRNLALSKEYDSLETTNYPGVMSKDKFWTNEHTQVFQKITNEPVVPLEGTSLCGKFRFTKENDPFTQYIHFDPGVNQVWSGVVYLTKPEHYTLQNGEVINAGTSFWRHKETQLESIPLSHKETEKYGWKTYEDLKKFLETDGCNETKWIRTFTVPIKYNRLVLFRPWMFHSSGVQFGSNFENCRLIQTIFLRLP